MSKVLCPLILNNEIRNLKYGLISYSMATMQAFPARNTYRRRNIHCSLQFVTYACIFHSIIFRTHFGWIKEGKYSNLPYFMVYKIDFRKMHPPFLFWFFVSGVLFPPAIRDPTLPEHLYYGSSSPVEVAFRIAGGNNVLKNFSIFY